MVLASVSLGTLPLGLRRTVYQAPSLLLDMQNELANPGGVVWCEGLNCGWQGMVPGNLQMVALQLPWSGPPSVAVGKTAIRANPNCQWTDEKRLH